MTTYKQLVDEVLEIERLKRMAERAQLMEQVRRREIATLGAGVMPTTTISSAHAHGYLKYAHGTTGLAPKYIESSAPLPQQAVPLYPLKSGQMPKPGMMVKHDGAVFEIERLEVEFNTHGIAHIVAVGWVKRTRENFSSAPREMRIKPSELDLVSEEVG